MTPSPPSSVAATSDIEPPSSPVGHAGKSFASSFPIDDDDTQMADATPEPAEKSARSKGKAALRQDPNGQSQIGKIRHLKKEDGEPLWREDIQYDFLKAVFDNKAKVFTNSYEPAGSGPRVDFADLYITTMSESTKTSKVLKEKLLSDREAAKGMAMVCLLVNMGRMNTTLNFFPEMRAQLRTYHAIPSLQAHQDPHAYKQLQDAPRLKSILKGGAEDRGELEPTTLDRIKQQNVPRTNPVNLIFVMCATAQKISELHFPRNHEFHDLLMKSQYSSQSRARSFLWLMWFYLESDFTEEGCEENPFGPGVDYGLDVANQGVPELEEMTDEEKALENQDSQAELDFGRAKQKIRAKILEMDQVYLHERENKRGKARVSLVDDGPAILPRIRPSKNDSDIDSTRSTPPPRGSGRNEPGGSKRRGASLKYQLYEGSSPAPHVNEGVSARKPRPPTAHQLAVERNRNQRVEYILDRGMRRAHHKSRKVRRQDGAIFRAHKRVKVLEDPFEDSDGEEPRSLAFGGEQAAGVFREKGLNGLCLLSTEPDDYGEEVSSYAAALRRATRRLNRWWGRDLGVIAPVRRPKPVDEAEQRAEQKTGDETEDDDGEMALMGRANGNTNGNLDGGADDDADGDGYDDVDANDDVTMDDIEVDDQTALAEDEDADDPDKTDIMGDSDVE